MMIKVAFEEGFTSSNTIRISKRLDLLLNKLKLAC
ncbi:Spo0E family sporulation regulatory protein-aspartic acid phosphatase [Bacillus megaterium]|nr:Spo0E family sporulation regulatory protein-aspartic acid phosphatase [Priestia megaterium]